MNFISRCSSCGKSIPTFNVNTSTNAADEMNGTHCDSCNDRFYRSMAEEFPHGQCPECGAAGYTRSCSRGVLHVLFSHSEGGCRYWGDMEDYEDGDCYMGCARPTTTAPAIIDDFDSLPF